MENTLSSTEAMSVTPVLLTLGVTEADVVLVLLRVRVGVSDDDGLGVPGEKVPIANDGQYMTWVELRSAKSITNLRAGHVVCCATITVHP